MSRTEESNRIGVVVGFAVLSVPADGFGTITAVADSGIVQLGLKSTF